MKYIKLFENKYIECEFYIKGQDKGILSENEINKILNFLNSKIITNKNIMISKEVGNNLNYNYIHIFNTNSNCLNIYKIEDEYYYVMRTYSASYKCDQIEGLFSYLKSIKNEINL